MVFATVVDFSEALCVQKNSKVPPYWKFGWKLLTLTPMIASALSLLKFIYAR